MNSESSVLRASPSLARVLNGDLCTGCGACAGLFPGKVVLGEESPGFLRPRQISDLASSEESLFSKICPGLGQEVNPGERKDSVLWGPFVNMMSGWATDPLIRYAGSSGGVLSAILVYLIREGIVDAIVQIGAAPDFVIGNTTKITTEVGEIISAAGSRYAPSAPLDGLRDLQTDGRRFAFVGKPCDAAALRSLIEAEPDFSRVFPVILSFFCAGVPSHAGGRAVLKALGASESDTLSFRYRGNGWPGRATAILKDGNERSIGYQDSWGRILSRHVQSRCKLCADGSGTAADIVCADAWETNSAGYPVFEDAEGVSLIVARTEFGEKLLSAVEASGDIIMAPFDVIGLAAIQPGQFKRRTGLFARILALRLLLRPVPRYRGLHLFAAARLSYPNKFLRNFFGTLWRALQGRI